MTLDNGVDAGTPTASLHDMLLFVNNTAFVPRFAFMLFHLAIMTTYLFPTFS